MKYFAFDRVLAALLFGSVIACDDPQPSADAGLNDSASLDGTPPDGEADAREADVGFDASLEPARIYGKIRLVEFYFNMDSRFQTSAGARLEYVDTMVNETPIATVDVCDIYRGNPTRMLPDPVDAGTLRVTGGSRALNFTRMGDGRYTVDLPATSVDLFAGGQVLRLAAEGGADVPPFVVEMPGIDRVTVSEPDLRALTSIDRAAPLAFNWVGAEGSRLHMEIKGGDVSVACRVDDIVGTYTIPPEALGYLPPGDGFVLVNRLSRMETRAGEAQILFEASNIESGNATIL